MAAKTKNKVVFHKRPVTVEKLKKLYPKPVEDFFHSREKDKNSTDYCVGGAVVLYLASLKPTADYKYRFPTESILAQALIAANPFLSKINIHSLADEYAEQITGANDSGDFKQAWAILDEALRLTLKPRPKKTVK